MAELNQHRSSTTSRDQRPRALAAREDAGEGARRLRRGRDADGDARDGGRRRRRPRPAEEKTEFNVTLTEVGADKIKVIKVVREVTSLGLKEAKDLVESAPKPIRKREQGRGGRDQEEVDEVGAKVTIS